MRFRGSIHDPDERLRIRTLLESRGIPVFEQAGRWTVTGRAMFVCIDAQYEDALALLANEDHEVHDPVDVAEFEKSERTVGLQLELKYASLALGALLLLWIAVIAFAWWSGMPILPTR